MTDWVRNFSIPSNVLLCGPSGCGKSKFIEKILQTPCMWNGSIDNLYYCYGIYTDNVRRIVETYPAATVIEHIPRNLDQPHEIFNRNERNVIIFDDLGSETQSSSTFTNFMSRGSHHSNVCMLSLEHHLFSDEKERKKQTNHWHCIILFRNKRSVHQIGTLARQTSIANPQLVQWAYRDATSKPYGYLVMDFRNDTPEEMRLLTNVMCENNEPTWLYA